MNYQTVARVGASEGSTGTWSLDGQLFPNPLQFSTMLVDDSESGVWPYSVSNAQVPGESFTGKVASFCSSFTRWRLAYASVTIYQDGPDLANQGTVAICQKPVVPSKYSVAAINWAGGTPSGFACKHAFHLADSDLPQYDASQAMPNAYFGKSKEGAYIPLKLTRTHQKWHSADDLMYQATSSSLTSMTDPDYGALTGGQLNIPTSGDREAYGQYPFTGANDLHFATNFGLNGSLVPDFCNDIWADFSFRNLATTTSLSFFFRYGFEVQVQPQSQMAPHLKLSPPHDFMAIQTYFAISRELKDAYPADYNDAGKIWGVISQIAKSVAPFLSGIPVVGPLLSMAVPAIAKGGDAIAAAVNRAKGNTIGSVLSAGDIEAIRAARAPVAPRHVVTKDELKRAQRAISQRAVHKRN